MATIDELAERLRFVETDLRSEKDFARTQLEQSVRNGAAIATLSVRFDQLAADFSAVRGELRMHSTILPVLQQDVSVLKQEMIVLRRGQEELHARLDAFQAGVTTRLDAMERNIAAILAAVSPGGRSPG